MAQAAALKNNPLFSTPQLRDSKRWRGMRIGLLGGSFNPPHKGHLHIANIARRVLGLDCIWWIVTPQNPLKDKANIAPYSERFSKVEHMLQNCPRQIPTHLERDLGTNYTYETVQRLQGNFSATDFIWICGMDNAHIFHKWDRWHDLARTIPIVFIARPPAKGLIQSPPIRNFAGVQQKFISKGQRICLKKPCIFWMKNTKMMDISSTQIRNKIS